MESKDKEYLRDLIAMFALNGIIANEGVLDDRMPNKAYLIADLMLKAREKNEEDIDGGITTIVPKRKRSRSNS